MFLCFFLERISRTHLEGNSAQSPRGHQDGGRAGCEFQGLAGLLVPLRGGGEWFRLGQGVC